MFQPYVLSVPQSLKVIKITPGGWMLNLYWIDFLFGWLASTVNVTVCPGFRSAFGPLPPLLLLPNELVLELPRLSVTLDIVG
jgi:hypothetical protein